MARYRMSISEAAVSVLILLASMNFFGKYFYIMLFAFLLTLVKERGSLRYDAGLIVLTVFSALCFAAMLVQGKGALVAAKMLVFPLAYLTGRNLFLSEDGRGIPAEKGIIVILAMLCAGNLLHALLNIINSGGTAIPELSRNAVDIWSGETMSATHHAAFLSLGMALCIAVIFSESGSKARIFAFILICLILGYDLVLACRSTIVIMLVTVLSAVIYMHKSGISAEIRRKCALQLTLSLAVILIFVLADAFGIKEKILTSNLITRLFGKGGIGISDSRMSAKLVYLAEVFRYPFGGSHLLNEFGYAHDLVLDTWDACGALPAVLICVFVIMSVRQLVGVLKNRSVSFGTRQMLLCAYLSFYAEFLIEPIIYGLMWMLSGFCLVCGASQSVLSANREKI